jgi:hypothetical protein
MPLATQCLQCPWRFRNLADTVKIQLTVQSTMAPPFDHRPYYLVSNVNDIPGSPCLTYHRSIGEDKRLGKCSTAPLTRSEPHSSLTYLATRTRQSSLTSVTSQPHFRSVCLACSCRVHFGRLLNALGYPSGSVASALRGQACSRRRLHSCGNQALLALACATATGKGRLHTVLARRQRSLAFVNSSEIEAAATGDVGADSRPCGAR